MLRPVLSQALNYSKLGIEMIAVGPDKKPIHKNWPELATTNEQALISWFGHFRYLIGLLCKKIAVIDADNAELARWWYVNMPRTPWMTRTPRGGGHFYYLAGNQKLRNAVKVNGKWDVRAGGRGFVVAGNQHIAWNKVYSLIGEPTLDLPLFDPEWLPKEKQQKEIQAADDRLALISRALRYAEKMPPSVSGQRGHDSAFRFACKMIRQPPNGFGLSVEEAWSIALTVFNPRCVPPWPEHLLRRKLTEALRKG